MTSTSPFTINAGFLPLLDAAILIAARERGFAADEGIDLNLVRETSWANIRDRMAIGHMEAAQMLAPMPIAAALGLVPISVDIIAPMALGLGGNAVTVANDLAAEMAQTQDVSEHSAATAGRALAAALENRRARGGARTVFAVVHPHSGHNYDLRYWLAASGIKPGEDVDIVIVPPPLMPDALAVGRIDGFCVGEPWNSVAVSRGTGTMITTKSQIWRSSPEKVLGVTAAFADRHPDITMALIRALYRAAQWCGDAANTGDLAELLATPNYVGVPADLLKPALTGEFPAKSGDTYQIPDFYIPFDRAATFPWKSHALWFYSQMVRWGDADWQPDQLDRIAGTYRSGLYRQALAPLDIPLPAASAKVEGALTETVAVGASRGGLMLGPDGFFDGTVFDPEAIEAYVRDQAN